MSRASDRTAAELFFALGDGTRLALIRKLGGGVSLSATALAASSLVTRQAIAKHLQVLARSGLVVAERSGREVLYALDAQRLDEAQDFLAGISRGWDRAIERLRLMVEPPSAPARSGVRRRRAGS